MTKYIRKFQIGGDKDLQEYNEPITVEANKTTWNKYKEQSNQNQSEQERARAYLRRGLHGKMKIKDAFGFDDTESEEINKQFSFHNKNIRDHAELMAYNYWKDFHNPKPKEESFSKTIVESVLDFIPYKRAYDVGKELFYEGRPTTAAAELIRLPGSRLVNNYKKVIPKNPYTKQFAKNVLENTATNNVQENSTGYSTQELDNTYFPYGQLSTSVSGAYKKAQKDDTKQGGFGIDHYSEFPKHYNVTPKQWVDYLNSTVPLYGYNQAVNKAHKFFKPR